jgi:hypothetical protein
MIRVTQETDSFVAVGVKAENDNHIFLIES